MKEQKSFQEQLMKVHTRMNESTSPVGLQVVEEPQMTTPSDTGNSTYEDEISSVPPGESAPFVDTTTELRPAGPTDPYFERPDHQGRPRRYLDRRRDRLHQAQVPQFHGYVEVTVGNDKTHIPLTVEERRQFMATTEKIHAQTARNTAMVFWAQAANAAMGILGAIGLGYAMYRGIRHDVTKDTKMP